MRNEYTYVEDEGSSEDEYRHSTCVQKTGEKWKEEQRKTEVRASGQHSLEAGIMGENDTRFSLCPEGGIMSGLAGPESTGGRPARGKRGRLPVPAHRPEIFPSLHRTCPCRKRDCGGLLFVVVLKAEKE